MKMALMSKNKLKFIDGSLQIPAITNPLYSAWERCNTMVLSWLTHSLSQYITQRILWIDKAIDVWKDLKERFAQDNILRISDLQEEIFSLKQGDSSVTEYFTELKILWDEFINFKPLPVCSCPNRSICGAIVKIKKYQDHDYVIRFLKGLNEQFGTIKSQILLLDPFPSINKAFSLVIQQERHIGYSNASTFGANPIDVKAFVNKVSQDPRTRPFSSQKFAPKFFVGIGDNRFCTYCGKTRHKIKTCYKKHGYPLGYKQRFYNAYANMISFYELQHGDQQFTVNFTPQHSTPQGNHSSTSVALTQE
ncbi:uncharacterized protein LOC131172214 [Hevea brasiliensis]|uniref:uncharacterized protein LOC131172214 n=1 Tax=Hevea brasiliensis TaxID=3981 RepID=UPI0025DEBC8A|nr:uncharacterized protein LOC131172214 [Hevea brasiliensis]